MLKSQISGRKVVDHAHQDDDLRKRTTVMSLEVAHVGNYRCLQIARSDLFHCDLFRWISSLAPF